MVDSVLCVQLRPSTLSFDNPKQASDQATPQHWSLNPVTTLPWHHPVTLEPMALPMAQLHRLPPWRELGDRLIDDDPALALALFRVCFYTHRVHHGPTAVDTLDAQVAVGECLCKLHAYDAAYDWLHDAMERFDAAEVDDTAKMHDCMATLGHVLLQRQALPQARSLLERVALLDELEAGPSAFVTLESLLEVATVYRYMGKFEAAMNVVVSVVATAEKSFEATCDDVWEDMLHNGVAAECNAIITRCV
ncbi:hypothetical protein SPRG_13546 [Saprolegnia parasitica CBS 223.65]|uniref:MalT-like TPR region domain-containing protein n=1 Tax=Saprolegnia parasitica (strain CBS 223.65) TaxID=695850 RepID=A0A067BQN3_SAPPC|nr:hypothetical protein SPRG_13546 [Saprolegnia parasitica CBS 223.65]KDO20794.1 hypothetical protein SPRG_13546 [Saprolegnia parasitica CBS 223.65]|eukprot:XP_012208532.1 hypothetical protein SPRG_13546 [Saprolegnia parasitica CBS 223.65]